MISANKLHLIGGQLKNF